MPAGARWQVRIEAEVAGELELEYVSTGLVFYAWETCAVRPFDGNTR